MNKKNLFIALPLLLTVSFTSCTKDNTKPSSSINVNVLEINMTGSNSPSDNTKVTEAPKEQVKPQPAVELPKEEVKPEPPKEPTVKGTFAVGSKGSYFIADGGARCKYYTQIKGNYLFHRVLYDSKGEKIIDGTLGVPVSHGCVRLATENAKFIYDNIPAGTTIWSN